jgi:tetratricopeptide (TPR) repeat protein
MDNEVISTGFAPPYRELLGTPRGSVSLARTEANHREFPTVPGYEILGELGRGGMGVVYQARQCSLQRLVAVKMILAGLDADATACLRFHTEARAVARLQHPNIVQIHEVGECEGRPFLSLEYVDGGNLLNQIAGMPQPERNAARLLETLARAVHSMHQRGILHRDLKPTNVLVTADGTPKISDFGLAKVLDADMSPTRSETFFGTPSYMAPEQAGGDAKKIGPLADVYSLGAILYELLAGHAPFQGATPLATLVQVRGDEPISPRRLRPSLSRDLETICLKCLEKEPGQRYSSAAALADDLHRFLEGKPTQARPIPVWQRLGRSARRHPARVGWALATAILFGLLLTAWFYFQAADQLAPHRAEEQYQRFNRLRNEAFLYGLLAPDEGALFLGTEVAANLQNAESAARQALALAGMAETSGKGDLGAAFPAHRKAELAADCYALLLVLAAAQEHAPVAAASGSASPGGKERYQEALRILDRARQLGFQTRAYHVRRAHFLELVGEKEEAGKDRDLAASITPATALDHFLIGEEQYRRGDWKQAMNSFHRAVHQQAGHFWAQFFLAVCHLKGKQWEAAKVGLNACINQQPDFVWTYLFRSLANERLRALPEAEADFQKALELNPKEDARYVLYLTRGILYFNQREPERAAADFRSAQALKPEQYNAYVNLAQVYLVQGRIVQAEEQMQTALRFRPPLQVVVGYQVERGRILLRNKGYEDALQACQEALEQSPRQPLPQEVRGRALLGLGRYDQAEKAFDQYLQNGGEETSDIFRGRGLARMKLGKYPEAVEDYTRALERAPDADIYQHRGWAHFFSDAWKLALRDFSKAIELDAAMGDAYTGRGLAAVMLGNYRGAAADADEALHRQPNTPEMMHNIACIFAQALARAQADRQEKDRQSLTESYKSRALQAVRRTLAMLRPEERTSFWRDKILPDVALMPIHNEKEFKRLQEKYSPR